MQAGDILVKRYSELVEDYKGRNLPRDVRDDLIDALEELTNTFGLSLMAYAGKYGTDEECGVTE